MEVFVSKCPVVFILCRIYKLVAVSDGVALNHHKTVVYNVNDVECRKQKKACNVLAWERSMHNMLGAISSFAPSRKVTERYQGIPYMLRDLKTARTKYIYLLSTINDTFLELHQDKSYLKSVVHQQQNFI